MKPGITNWPVGKDLSNFVSVTIRISTFPITASARSSNLFRTEFILMCDVTIRFKFIVLISFSFVLKSSLVACYSGNRHWFLHISSFRIIWSTFSRKSMSLTWWAQRMLRFRNSISLGTRASLVYSKYWDYQGFLSAWGDLLRFSVPGAQKKLLGCGLLGGDQYSGWHYVMSIL